MRSSLKTRHISLEGAFSNYVDRILPFFDAAWTDLYRKRGQKQTFFDTPPLNLST